jgi:signal transduction histidine kinase
MAELAAGAGHEINTPLAIISGQAQYLLAGEDDPERRKALQAVVQQTRRVHDILTGLMQFALPARPNRQVIELGLLVQEVVAQHIETAEARNVRIEQDVPEGSVAFADARQVRIALGHLVRNAIEAAGEGGWVRLGRVPAGPGALAVAVVDSGPGPDPAVGEHLFDPFFSGRQAGRGRGLGLSTAWRLAREQGGTVRFDPDANGATRFVLSLPQADTLHAIARISA